MNHYTQTIIINPDNSVSSQHIAAATHLHEQGTAYRIGDSLVLSPDQVEQLGSGKSINPNRYYTQVGDKTLYVEGTNKKKAISSLLYSLFKLKRGDRLNFEVENQGKKTKYLGFKNGKQYRVIPIK